MLPRLQRGRRRRMLSSSSPLVFLAVFARGAPSNLGTEDGTLDAGRRPDFEDVLVNCRWCAEHTRGAVQYLRIAKTGSTSLLDMFRAAHSHAPSACKRLMLNGHSTVPRDLAPDEPEATFAVMREPCERFASQYDHVRTISCHRFVRSRRPHDPVCSLSHGVKGAIAWAELLLANSSYARHWGVGPPTAERPTWSVVAWPQSAYVDADVKVACLPTMRRDVQAIFDEFLPGCVLPASREENRRGSSSSPTEANDALCAKVRKLHPEDFELWNQRCVGETWTGRRV